MTDGFGLFYNFITRCRIAWLLVIGDAISAAMFAKCDGLQMPIEIDVGAGLLIASEGDGNRFRFAQVFREVWFGIPVVDRQAIGAHWHKGIAGQDRSPQIVLLAGYDRPGSNDGFGNTLTFNSCVVDLLDKEGLLANLIAHELGHVYRYATNSPAHAAFPPNIPAKEDEADAKAVEWGYDMQALRDWTNEHADEMVGYGIHIPMGGRW